MFGTKSEGKIKRSHLILLGLIIASGIALRFFQLHYSDAQISLKGESLHVILAKNPKQWYKGLSDRESLGEYDGMLFLFPFYEKHGFVMRRMHFSLDMVWLAGGKVVDIAPDVPVFPQDRPYYPREEANAVLELPGGWVRTHGLEIGDTMTVVDE